MTDFKNKTLFHFQKQNGFCVYCDEPMWITDPDHYRQKLRLTPKQARQRQATPEHLVAKSEGGSNDRDNLGAACRFCNTQRHKCPVAKSAEDHRQHVRRCMEQGKWRQAKLHRPDSYSARNA